MDDAILGWKDGKKVFQANGTGKQKDGTNLISHKIDFKPDLMKIQKGHFIVVKGTVHQDDLWF